MIHSKIVKPFFIKRFVAPLKVYFNEQRDSVKSVRDMAEVFIELRDMLPKLKQVCKMVLPNHGSSLPDGVSRIESQLMQLSQQLSSSEAIQEAMLLDHPKSIFISDDEGRNLFVNKRYAEVLKCERDDLLSLSWRTYVVPTELVMYDALWRSAFKEMRDSFFTMMMRRKADLAPVRFSVKVTVLRNNSGNPTGKFLGVLDEVPIHEDD